MPLAFIQVVHPELLPGAVIFLLGTGLFVYSRLALSSALWKAGCKVGYWKQGLLFGLALTYLRHRGAIRTARMDFLASFDLVSPLVMLCGGLMMSAAVRP